MPALGSGFSPMDNLACSKALMYSKSLSTSLFTRGILDSIFLTMPCGLFDPDGFLGGLGQHEATILVLFLDLFSQELVEVVGRWYAIDLEDATSLGLGRLHHARLVGQGVRSFH